MDAHPIQLALIARPTRLSMRERSAFEVGLAATNRGTATIHPELFRVRLLVDGHDALVWADAIGNGLREPAWYALAPGATVSKTWSGMGELLLPAPGAYRFVLELGSVRSDAVEVHVTP